jgi:hypothetical protein
MPPKRSLHITKVRLLICINGYVNHFSYISINLTFFKPLIPRLVFKHVAIFTSTCMFIWCSLTLTLVYVSDGPFVKQCSNRNASADPEVLQIPAADHHLVSSSVPPQTKRPRNFCVRDAFQENIPILSPTSVCT